ncbi:hypothetical protein PITC_012830 [Penicillium italicum]|uniref:NAD-dependent epimerase/dehydratase domain-containing protein n=1 Tax=Penicillium italicum TaxID=40296 RepID=A0A0A2KAY8_PENIT|nr:hypothetical protein PITC_012830 [Penicillium italicum]
MHVFVTGATGFIGRAVDDELLTAGHTVTGLARSDEAASALAAKGVKVLRGFFRDPEVVIKYVQNCLDEKETIEAIGSVLDGTNKPLVTTSGTLGLTHGKVGTEDEVVDYERPMNNRAQNEKVISGKQKGVAGSKYHAVGEEGVAMKDIAEANGHNLGLPAVSMTLDEAGRLDSFVS